jgi:hypothetical protein
MRSFNEIGTLIELMAAVMRVPHNQMEARKGIGLITNDILFSPTKQFAEFG